MKKIYLIRHAQSVANAMPSTGEPVQYCNADIPITELGKRQAHELAIWLDTHLDGVPDGVFVSPYLRTQETAQPFLAKINATATMLDELHEFNYLSFDNIKGKTFAELKPLSDAFWAKHDAHYQDGADSDSFASFYEQINQIRAYFQELADGTYVVFGHGFWIGLFLWQMIGRGGINMSKFREFELLVRPKNTEVFLWQIVDGMNAVAKVRNLRGDDRVVL
ncbi:MAG: phosphoglycerate mutase family protein [Moraxella sp.]|nr:phosphoglycerate mutase family protein [Moraxella sp.]